MKKLFKSFITYKKNCYEERPITVNYLSTFIKEFNDYYKSLNKWKSEKLLNNMTNNSILLLNKYENNSLNNKIEIKKYKKSILIKCLKQLNNCFTINKNVKQKAYSTKTYICECNNDITCNYCYGTGVYDHTEVDYDLRNGMYKLKSLIIKECIILIKEYRLPIKYGKNEGIIYFEYLGHQVSFHDPKNKINCKKFNGVWNEIINKKIPFIINKKRSKL